MDRIKIKQLFSGMCCSKCGHDFEDKSIKILREEDGLFVIQLVCQECKKSFGIAFLGLESITLKNNNHKEEELQLQIQDGPPPIDFDDVIDAHKFIRNLDEDWSKYIPEDLKNKKSR